MKASLDAWTSVSPNRLADGSAPPPILIAENDEDDRFFTVRMLRRISTPHPIICFPNGLDLIGYLSEQWLGYPEVTAGLPRLVFLDLKMPVIGGFDFLIWLRTQPARVTINTVVLSGSDDPRDVERAKALGAKRYLVKHPALMTIAGIVNDAHDPNPLIGAFEGGCFFAPSVTLWQDGNGKHLSRLSSQKLTQSSV